MKDFIKKENKEWEEEKGEDPDSQKKLMPFKPTLIELDKKGNSIKPKKSGKERNNEFYSFGIYNLMITIACESIKRYYKCEEFSHLVITIFENEDSVDIIDMNNHINKAKELSRIQNYSYFLVRALEYKKEM